MRPRGIWALVNLVKSAFLLLLIAQLVCSVRHAQAQVPPIERPLTLIDMMRNIRYAMERRSLVRRDFFSSANLMQYFGEDVRVVTVVNPPM